MLRLKDRSALTDLPAPPDGIELPPLREPEWLEATPSYVSSSGVTIMTSKELAEDGSAATPPLPRRDRFGDRMSHITGRFVLTASNEAYRIWRYQSAEAPVEFPVTEDGWAEAWTAFRGFESNAA
jgi:hypothetical protein